jgi:IS5 family transposase
VGKGAPGRGPWRSDRADGPGTSAEGWQADAACEDVLLDSAALRRLGGVNLGREQVPDATTLLKFYRLLEKQKLGGALFAKVGKVLQAHGLEVGTDTIVDVTIIGAPSSTKIAGKKRDPEMHQTRRARQGYFGIKLHIGVDSKTGRAHGAALTAAKVHDKHPLPQLLHDQEEQCHGDCAYASQTAQIRSKGPKAKDLSNHRVCKRSVTEEFERLVNRAKFRVRARVEHVFGVVKRLWGFDKARYRGLAKSVTRTFTALGLANILQARGVLCGQACPQWARGGPITEQTVRDGSWRVAIHVAHALERRNHPPGRSLLQRHCWLAEFGPSVSIALALLLNKFLICWRQLARRTHGEQDAS